MGNGLNCRETLVRACRLLSADIIAGVFTGSVDHMLIGRPRLLPLEREPKLGDILMLAC